MKTLVAPDIEAYAEAHSMPESAICRALREETSRTMAYAQMLVGPLEGAFLKMMTRLVGAKRVLEIGMFTGYSALCFAEAVPDGGRINPSLPNLAAAGEIAPRTVLRNTIPFMINTPA